jgi:hypothetical protein
VNTYMILQDGKFLGTVEAETREEAIEIAAIEFEAPAETLVATWRDPEF